MSKVTRLLVRSRYSKNSRLCFSSNLPSRTKQNHKEECDINQIMRKFEKTGQLPELIRKQPSYGNFADPVTYHEAQNLVLHAVEQFEALPSKVRERFGNEPERFLAFASDGRNAEEMAKMGLMDPKAVERVRKAKESKKTPSPDMGGGKKGPPEAKSDQLPS